MFTKPFLRLRPLLILWVTLLTACADNVSRAPATSAPAQSPAVSTPQDELGRSTTGASKGGWTGTITMFAQEYTPRVQQGGSSPTAFRRIADEYERTHPGIKIKFIDEDVEKYNNDTIQVKAAGGELYDVFWAQWAALNSTLPQGIAVDLTPYFRQKNPYIPDSPTWQDAMNQTVVNNTAAPSGAHYNINGDLVATGFFYNKALFQKAGIAGPPKTWRELLNVSAQLKRAGIPAVVEVPYYPWWARHFLSDFYAQDFDRIAGFDRAEGISALDQAIAMKKGIFSTNDPRFLGWWPVFKAFTDSWVPDYLAQAPENNDATFRDFVAGGAAMYYSGSWLPNQLRDARVPFEYGVFNFPPLGAEVSPLSTGVDTSNAVGGPNAAFQYAISTPQANATMNESGKFEAVLDWLRYLGRPAVIEQVVNEQGSFIPTWPGTTPKPGSELLASQANQKLRAITSTDTSAQLETDLQQIFGLYLAGNVDLEQAKPRVQQALDRALQDYVAKTNANLDAP